MELLGEERNITSEGYREILGDLEFEEEDDETNSIEPRAGSFQRSTIQQAPPPLAQAIFRDDFISLLRAHLGSRPPP